MSRRPNKVNIRNSIWSPANMIGANENAKRAQSFVFRSYTKHELRNQNVRSYFV